MNRKGGEKRENQGEEKKAMNTLEIWKKARERRAQMTGELTVNLLSPGGAWRKKNQPFDCCLKEGPFQ